MQEIAEGKLGARNGARQSPFGLLERLPGSVRLVIIGVIFHVIYTASIFDIYFRSPLITGLPLALPDDPTSHTNASSASAPARRLFLFVGDGLRADKCFERVPGGEGSDQQLYDRAPFLKGIARTTGVWGISHTRVPTESRPGHVAMIAGFYEDVSAVTKGWARNPVAFDHVLRRANRAYAFGLPEIVDMFHGPRVTIDKYDEAMVDFALDATLMDKWAFDRLARLFGGAPPAGHEADRSAAGATEGLDPALHEAGLVVFVHLLGLDTNGHAHGPHSKQYVDNIAYVDGRVKQSVEMIEKFYGHDGQSAYLFTSDHGMSDGGTHGDGHPDNTRCPFVAWGAGLDMAIPADSLTRSDEASTVKSGSSNALKSQSAAQWSTPYPSGVVESWGLASIERRDVNQADLTPLMASLVGLPVPSNSEGLLPVHVFSPKARAYLERAAINNLRQLTVALCAAEKSHREREPLFRPFARASCAGLTTHIIPAIKAAAAASPEEASGSSKDERIRSTLELMHVVLEGIAYYQRYDRAFLQGFVALGYLAWIVYAVLTLADIGAARRGGRYGEPCPLRKTRRPSLTLTVVRLCLLCLALALAATLWRKGAPVQYYAYAGFPLAFAAAIAGKIAKEKDAASFYYGAILRPSSQRVPLIACYVAGLELLVAAFFKPALLAVAVPIMALLMAAFLRRRFSEGSQGAGDRAGWWNTGRAAYIAASLPLAIFPVLDPIQRAEPRLLAGGILAILGLAAVLICARPSMWRRRSMLRAAVRLAVIAGSGLLVFASDRAFKSAEGLSAGRQVGAWAILAYATLSPILAARGTSFDRLFEIFLTLAPLYILLSISYEVLFYAAFAAPLLVWNLLMDDRHSTGHGSKGNPGAAGSRRRPSRQAEGERSSTWLDGGREGNDGGGVFNPPAILLAFKMTLMILVSFFGTGNFASISSFTLSSVYRFITRFEPFLMAALLIGKLLIPVVILAASMGVTLRQVSLEAFSVFLLVISTIDILTINFFFLVLDRGSWLEIGTSISHFILANSFSLVALGVYGLSNVLLAP